VFARTFSNESAAQRDYCVSLIPFLEVVSKQATVKLTYGSLESLPHERSATYLAPISMTKEYVECGDPSVSCASAYGEICGDVKGKIVLYAYNCDAKKTSSCFPCLFRPNIIEQLAFKGARAVVFVPKTIATDDYIALNKTSRASYSVTGNKEFDIHVFEAVEGQGGDVGRFFNPDFEKDNPANRVTRPELLFWWLESPKKINKIVAMPLLAIIALTICCYSATLASNVAHRDRLDYQEREQEQRQGRHQRKKQVAPSGEECQETWGTKSGRLLQNMFDQCGAGVGPPDSHRWISAFDLFLYGLGDSGSFRFVRHRCPLLARPLPASDPTHSLWRDLFRGSAR